MAINNLTILTLNQPGIVDFAQARNDLLQTVTTKWAIFLDQDEEPTPELQAEIEQVLKNPKYTAYSLQREDIFLGAKLKYGENARNRFVRLVRVGNGRFVRPVHEVWEGEGRVGELHGKLIHRLGNLTDFLKKIDTYSTLEAEYRYSLGKRATLAHVITFPFGKLLLNLVLRGGIFDGVPGMIMAGLMSFHSYLTWTKLYLLWQHK